MTSEKDLLRILLSHISIAHDPMDDKTSPRTDCTTKNEEAGVGVIRPDVRYDGTENENSLNGGENRGLNAANGTEALVEKQRRAGYSSKRRRCRLTLWCPIA